MCQDTTWKRGNMDVVERRVCCLSLVYDSLRCRGRGCIVALFSSRSMGLCDLAFCVRCRRRRRVVPLLMCDSGLMTVMCLLL